MADSVVDITHDLHSILSSPNRDFLLRNTGDQVLHSTLTPFLLYSLSSFYEIVKEINVIKYFFILVIS